MPSPSSHPHGRRLRNSTVILSPSPPPSHLHARRIKAQAGELTRPRERDINDRGDHWGAKLCSKWSRCHYTYRRRTISNKQERSRRERGTSSSLQRENRNTREIPRWERRWKKVEVHWKVENRRDYCRLACHRLNRRRAESNALRGLLYFYFPIYISFVFLSTFFYPLLLQKKKKHLLKIVRKTCSKS